MLNKSLFFVLVIVSSQLKVFAQQINCNITLSGKVIDDHDNSPLMFATIYIKELERGAVSDEKGNYLIENLCPGTYTLVCNHLGCDELTEIITITKSVKHNFYPEHHTEELQSFSLIEEAFVEEKTVPKKELSIRELNQSRGKSLGESLKSIPGVTSLNTGNNVSKPVIHGLHSDRVLILNNGIRQEGQQWGSEHAPEIDPFIAKNISVIKGAESIRYGANAIAGVVLVEPHQLRDSAGINGELNTVGASNGKSGVASAMLEGNIGKLKGLSWRLQGTTKQSGNIHTPDYFMKNTGVKEQNFSWALGFNQPKYGLELFYSQFNSDMGIFSAAHIGNLTDLKKAIDSDVPLESADFTYDIDRPFQHIEHELFKAKAYWFTGDAGKLNLVYARQYNYRSEYDKHRPRKDSLAALNLPELQFTITTHTGDLIWEQNRIKAFKSIVGVSAINQANTISGRQFIPAFVKYGYGAFFIEKWRSDNAKLELEAGVRYDYIYQQAYVWKNKQWNSPEFEYQNYTASIGGIYKLTPDFTIRANIGSAWRPPSVSELFSDGLHHGAAAVEYGDTNLVAENAYNSTLSLEYAKDKLVIQAEGYYNFINNFIYLAPTLPATLTIRGAFPTFNYKQVDAVLKGLDFKASYKLMKNLTWTGKAAVLRAFNQQTKNWLIGMPADRLENGLTFELPKLKSLQEAYLGISIGNVFTQTRVPANSDYTNPPAGYTLLNVQTGIKIPIANQKIAVDFEINNLLNTTYRDYLNRFRYFADEMGRNYSIKINIPFNLNSKK